MDLTGKASICERWTIPLGEQGPEQWFADYALREPAQVSRHLTAGYLAYRSLLPLHRAQPFTSATEYFGGLGAQSLMIRRFFQPEKHTVIDSHPLAELHLHRLLGPLGVRTVCANSYATLAEADLVGLDFGDLTAHRAVRGPHRNLLDRVFARSPRAVVLTDIAGPRLHLHAARYAEALGGSQAPADYRLGLDSTAPFTSYEDYLKALASWMHITYGYHPLRIYWHRWSAVLVLVRDRQQNQLLRLEPVTEQTSPRGLELL
jgi:hypothetical protein